ncbi:MULTISPECIES: transcriptional regulator, SarA/Rot family [Staphylococcus]|uniref:transcriptional regulator, SarA/Rot family n=1 Tax=Staphylococcus TaxID=1279 RepID=UPI000927A23B|nr:MULTISPECIES: winged helix DNA-binding protein [Staphylococcus]RNM25996.1 MarR family transcriptional regulator [Staphylococcus cohnii]MBL0377041.1 MarR family transcriptional regulator [Staphylococcus sp. S75]MBL0384018.1 MarR family transcriptional regulator [Staphylococcus sp. S59]MBL0400332.1 MarR family transcriptional regulator [Staphylococcus sp. S36]MDU9371278.1 MarR family transcriptional regulator [Staphylococcus ureilyticus]
MEKLKELSELNELITLYQKGKQFFKETKKYHKLNYEEIFILNYIHECQSYEVTAKEIAQYSELKPYYLTKALQKLIKMGYLSKKRSDIDEPTVVVYINETQRQKIEHMIKTLQDYLK